MALRETHVEIDFTADADPLRSVNQEINGIIRQSHAAGKAFDGLTDASKEMMRQMNTGWRNQSVAFLKFKNDLVAAEYEYHNLARGTAFFEGATGDLIQAITEVGAAHKKATDGMLANDDSARRSLYQTIGTMANITPMADKNAAALDRMNNPLYSVNKATLGVVSSLNRMANNANTARIALEQLGPTASMKELRDEQQRLNASLGAFSILLLVVGLGAILFYGQMHKWAMENKKYAEAWDKMVSTLRKTIQPMVDVFIMIMVPIYKFITLIGQLIIKFNEAHPTLAKMIQGVFLLIPALTLLLLPLGFGIGLIQGWRLAIGFLLKMIMPLITFMATLSATVWIVAAAIVGLAAAIIWLWNHHEGFKNAVITGWQMIQAAAITIWNFILHSVLLPVWNALVSFGKQLFGQLKAFWKENGDSILTIAKVIWEMIKVQVIARIMALVMLGKAAFAILKSVIQAVWGNIKSIIGGAVDVILGIIGLFVSILTGDWKSAWENVKRILQGAWEMMKGAATMGVNSLLGIVRGIGNALGGIFSDIGNSFYDAGRGFIDMMISGIESMIGKVTGAIGKVAGKVRDFLPFSPAKTGPLSDLDQLDFGNPIMDSIKAAQRMVLPAMNLLLGGESSAVYTPENSATTTYSRSKSSVVFSPTIQLTSNSGSSGSIKQQIKEALDEAFDYWNTLYQPEGEY